MKPGAQRPDTPASAERPDAPARDDRVDTPLSEERLDKPTGDERLDTRACGALAALLLGLIAITLPELGSDPWRFRPPTVDPQGPLAPLVRAAGEEWDLGIPRAGAFCAALLVAAASLPLFRGRAWSRRTAVLLVLAVGVLLAAPATLLQLGLRDSTAPWFHTNDSVYQIDLAGDLVLDGDNPYGHDYKRSGLERFYTRDGSASERVREREVALEHFAYFPGSVITAVPWRLLPEPFDDYRLLVLLSTLAMLAAALAFRAPLGWRLALGALLVCNPIAVRSAWFGQNDAPSLLLLVLAFALVTRRRFGWAAASLAGAILLKQFALVAAPFLAITMIHLDAGRVQLKRAALAFGGVLAAGILPFFLAGPVAFYEDTVKYGAGTYRIVGYGLSAILVRVGIVDDRNGAYPFALLALLTWVPLTAWLLLAQRRSRELWLGAAGFSVSILWLMFIGRTFNNYYLVWPMTGAVCAWLIACSSPLPSPSSPSSPSPSVASAARTQTGARAP
ncbi:MAG TPA: glycosyltransferase family 87 protein [Thermoleophilaceae bacterium]|nr:glycosyltransferase family 87 protein [Thermoleophilaceae bacterium]